MGILKSKRRSRIITRNRVRYGSFKFGSYNLSLFGRVIFVLTHLDFYKREVFIPLCNYSGKVASYVKKENEQAFLTLIKEYGRLIYKVCYLYATDEEHLKDLHQEVLIHLWQGFRSFKGEAKISSWIYRVSLNTCISFYRKHSKITDTMSLESLFDLMIDESDEKAVHLREMYRLISQLNRLEKAIILLWLDERSYESIERSNYGTGRIEKRLENDG